MRLGNASVADAVNGGIGAGARAMASPMREPVASRQASMIAARSASFRPRRWDAAARLRSAGARFPTFAASTAGDAIPHAKRAPGFSAGPRRLSCRSA